MIQFFRKIRLRSLSESKFSKYLLYAVGEIVLVVIGILIALQINNWNQSQKDRAYETKMLSEIVKSLKADRLHLDEQVTQYTKLSSSVDFFIDLSANNVLFHDSMQQELWNLNIGPYFQFNRGPYDAVKSSGIDRISNDSLRNHLINFFDFKLPVFHSQYDHATRRYRSNVESLLSLLGESYIDSTTKAIQAPVAKDILQRQAFINLLGDNKWRSGSAKLCIEEFVPEMDAMILHINAEIK